MQQSPPQGGVISPVLSNLFLHYAFDAWISKNHPLAPWCRYADDGLIHCQSEQQAKEILVELEQRFKECKLELHPDKTKIIYCKDSVRKGEYSNTSFDFLGYCFRLRTSRNRINNKLFLSFAPGVSRSAMKAMRTKTRESNIRNRTELSLEEIAKYFNPILRGWINYYGFYNKWALYPVLKHFNSTLHTWVRQKYKRYKTDKTGATRFIKKISSEHPELFAHWKAGMVSMFV